MGIEPELDCADGAHARETLNRARFVVSLSAFHSEAMAEYADVILPIAAFAETGGTFVNLSGTWQSFGAATPSFRGFAPGMAGAPGAGQSLRPDRLRARDARRRACGSRRAEAGRRSRVDAAPEVCRSPLIP